MSNLQNELEEFHCSSCGAKLFTDKTTIITRCVYCNSTEVVKQAYTSKFAPKKVLPFKITKEQFLNICVNHFNNSAFITEELKNNPFFKDIKGLYVPYYSANYDVRVYADGISTTGGEDAPEARFKIDFSEKAHVSNDASSKLDDSLMESLQPYNYSELVDFNPAYLTGFQAELPSESIQTVENRIDNRITKYCYDCVSQDMPYQFHSSGKEIYDFNRTTDFECILLPVWFVSTLLNGSRYTFLVNGQTGKIIGDIPLSEDVKKKRKRLKTAFTVSLVMFFISLFFMFFIFLLPVVYSLSVGFFVVLEIIIFFGGAGFIIFLFSSIFTGFRMTSLDNKIQNAKGIKHLYNIPIKSWDRKYSIMEPKKKRTRMSSNIIYYYSSGVKYQRYKNGIYLCDANIDEIKKMVKSVKKAEFTTNNKNL